MNFNSPSTEKLSVSEEHPCFSMNSSTITRLEIECLKAYSRADFKPSNFSTLVTPLLPAESVGFTITGQEYQYVSAMASSTVEKPLALGTLKPCCVRKLRNLSLFCKIHTDSYGPNAGSPICSCTYAAVTTPGSTAKDIIPLICNSRAKAKTASLSIMLTL